MFSLKQAQAQDISRVIALVAHAVTHMCENGIFQWDDIYPNEGVLRADIENEEMYLLIDDGHIVGAVVLNDRQDEAYQQGEWLHNGRCAVVHRLCIDPAFQGCGYGRQAMEAAEALLKQKGFESVRLDAFSQNPHALRLYEGLGYRKAGKVTYRKGLFYLYEKSLL